MEYHKNLDLSDIVYFYEFDNIWKTEKWKDIPNYEELYKISDLGRVKSLSRFVNNGYSGFISKERILKSSLNKKGYCQLTLCLNNKQKSLNIHQLVVMAFYSHIPCGMELVVDHKNNIKTDNTLGNLQLITQRDNGNKKHIKSSSKYVGVYWNKIKNKWSSQITINSKRINLGSFLFEIDAHNAYQKALKSLTNT